MCVDIYEIVCTLVSSLHRITLCTNIYTCARASAQFLLSLPASSRTWRMCSVLCECDSYFVLTVELSVGFCCVVCSRYQNKHGYNCSWFVYTPLSSWMCTWANAGAHTHTHTHTYETEDHTYIQCAMTHQNAISELDWKPLFQLQSKLLCSI